MTRVLVKSLLVLLYLASLASLPALAVLGWVGLLLRPRRRVDAGLRVFITARSDSRNWTRANFVPIAEADGVDEVLAVVDGPVVEHARIRVAPPPSWLRAMLGRAASKALWLTWLGWRRRPDIVVGYHFFPGALTALLVATLLRARAVYQMTGGPIELAGGGYALENPVLSKLGRPSPVLEWLALRLCRQFAAVVALGQSGRTFLEVHAAARHVAVIAPSIDVDRFAGGAVERPYDLVFVGRVMPVKQPEQILQIVARLKPEWPTIRAVFAGDGPLLAALRADAARLNIESNVTFLGHVERVEQVLWNSKVFILTSRTEGLSIALAEAMAAGVVPVVADVGDLGELVRDGETGYRVRPDALDAYAAAIRRLLTDPAHWERLSQAARARAIENNGLDAVARRWDRCLHELLPLTEQSRRQDRRVKRLSVAAGSSDA